MIKKVRIKSIYLIQCAKSVHIWSFSGPYSYKRSVFLVSLRIQSECGKIPTRKTPNTDTFYAVFDAVLCTQPLFTFSKSTMETAEH